MSKPLDREAIYQHGYTEGLKDAPEIQATELRAQLRDAEAAIARVLDLCDRSDAWHEYAGLATTRYIRAAIRAAITGDDT